MHCFLLFIYFLHLLTFKMPKRYKKLGSTKRGLGMNSFLIFVLLVIDYLTVRFLVLITK